MAGIGIFRGLACLLTLVALLGCSRAAAAEPGAYSIHGFSVSLSSTQAGAHADLATTISFAPEGGEPSAATRDLAIALPPGLVGAVASIPRCALTRFGETPAASACSIDSQVGFLEARVLGDSEEIVEGPVYNLDPARDGFARLGFFARGIPTLIDLRLDPITSGLTASLQGLSSAARLSSATLTLWGVPAAALHDSQRMSPLEGETGEGPPGGRPATAPPRAFLANPTYCEDIPPVVVTATSYLSSSTVSRTAPFPRLTGCGKLSFAPEFTIRSTSSHPSSPSGLDVELGIPQSDAPAALASSTLKSAEITLPAGVSLNPAAAEGLETCGAGQVRVGAAGPAQCPAAARVGSVGVEVPAIGETLRGSVYQRTPLPGRPFGLWITTEERGVHLKIPAEVTADPGTDRLRVSIGAESSIPQVPFGDLDLHLFSGPRAPLLTPDRCGELSVEYALTPWSGGPAVRGQAPVLFNEACTGARFSPRLEAGSLVARAGAPSPFVIKLERADAEPDLAAAEFLLPPGLSADLSSVPLCPESLATVGDCPAQSRIGEAAMATGGGSRTLWLPEAGRPELGVYLAGPYKGSPYSLVFRAPAQAGPFDLGTLVLRAAVDVDLRSGRISVRTDPLPQVVQGVALRYRTIFVQLDRPGFVRNPTDCAPSGTVGTARAADGSSASLAAPFQVTGCARLGLKPRVALRFSGNLRRNGHPALSARIAPRKRDANISAATIALPSGLLLDIRRIRGLCPRGTAAEDCPGASRVGRVAIRSPLLPEALRGSLFVRSPSDRYPDLIAVVSGSGLRMLVHGRTGAAPGGRLRIRLGGLPDLPISGAEVTLLGGARGILVSSEARCSGSDRFVVSFDAHNGGHRRQAAAPRCA